MKKLMVALCLAFLLSISTFSFATILPMGDPLTIGSWQQYFNESGVGLFDHMEVFIISGNTDLLNPPMYAFTQSGWGSSLINPDYGLASSLIPTSNMNFYIGFTAAQSIPFTFRFLAWRGGIFGTLLDHANAYWSGGGWNITNASDDPHNYNRSPIPEPSSVLLLGFGLIGIASIRFLKRRKI